MREILFRAKAINRDPDREYRTDYKNGDDKGNLDLSLTLNSKRDCSIDRPNLKEYAETSETDQDAMTMLLMLVLTTYSNYQA